MTEVLEALRPTAEQTHILDLVRTTDDNIMVNSLAGTGKTTMCEMIEGATTRKPVLYLCFNRKVADDAEKRMASTTTVKTFNSIGHGIWSKAIGRRFKPDARKIPDLLRLVISESKRPLQTQLWDNFWQIVEGVNKARAIGYIPRGHALAHKRLADSTALEAALDESPDDFVSHHIDSLLNRSISVAFDGLCDFNDQIYMPTLFGGGWPEFPLVMVDEYQDLNAINHRMVRLLAKHRLIGVGDPWQSIYEFRGAVTSGMATAARDFAMTPCDLSISFRCPEAIVRSVHWRVPHFKWIKPGGEVRELRELRIISIPEEATLICRNNAPLFRLAMKLLSAGRSVSVVGSDIGPRVIGQMKKLGGEDTTRASLLSLIASWLEARLAKDSKTAQDTADCMRVFAEHGETLGQALKYAEHLFTQKGRLVFTTGHKAKGLEWDTVYHLDPWLLNGSEQDKNLRYVISTRSGDKLFEVNSDGIKP